MPLTSTVETALDLAAMMPLTTRRREKPLPRTQLGALGFLSGQLVSSKAVYRVQ